MGYISMKFSSNKNINKKYISISIYSVDIVSRNDSWIVSFLSFLFLFEKEIHSVAQNHLYFVEFLLPRLLSSEITEMSHNAGHVVASFKAGVCSLK